MNFEIESRSLCRTIYLYILAKWIYKIHRILFVYHINIWNSVNDIYTQSVAAIFHLRLCFLFTVHVRIWAVNEQYWMKNICLFVCALATGSPFDLSGLCLGGFRLGGVRLGNRVSVGTRQLHKLDAGHKHVHREETVVFRNDDQRVAWPNDAGGEERRRLRDGQRFGGTAEVAQAGQDEALQTEYNILHQGIIST